MYKFILFLLLNLLTLSAFAVEFNYCSTWVKQDQATCLFASSSAYLYQRQCENPCIRSHQGSTNGPNCDQEQICYFKNPDSFRGYCSEWTKDYNKSCYDPGTQTWEQRWVRACTKGLAESWCSREKPF